ncbi:MAG: hypothetical protein LBB80_09970 [Treponema sp.]|jgi:hypothetical protein|nr:hypothetical protein [Treponema sp.]
MKKLVFAFLFSFMGFLLSGQADPSGGNIRDPMDMVVLLDTSSSMSSFYQEVSAFITGPLLQEFLGLGDTFHLISFSDKARLEISRRIEVQGDLEVIIGCMLLLYPLDPYSDITGALAYTEGYVSSLPGRRPKTMLLISDGDHNPAPGSPGIDVPGLQKLMADMQNRLSRRGIRFEVIKVPEGMNRRPRPAVQPAPRPPAPAPQTAAPVQPQTTGPRIQVPQAPASVLPQTSAPQTQDPASLRVSPLPPASALQMPILIPEPDLFIDPVPESVLPPEDFPFNPSDQEDASLPFTEEPVETPPDLREPPWGDGPENQATVEPQAPPERAGIEPEAGNTLFTASEVSRVRSQLIFLNTGFGVLAVLIIFITLGLLSRRLQGAPNRMLAHGTESPDFEGPPMISLFVKDQSTTLDRRNLHILKAGHSLSLGGGKSDFLIFLVPVPPHIARVYFDGTYYYFIPQKNQFFPDIGSKVIQDCIGKTIRIISEKNYELHIRIERREDPWYALSRLLTSITLPG